MERSCRDLSRPFLGMLQSPCTQSVYKCPNHWFGDLAKSKVKEEHREPGEAQVNQGERLNLICKMGSKHHDFVGSLEEAKCYMLRVP